MLVNEFRCPNCGLHFEAALWLGPFCRTCGSTTLTVIREFDRPEDCIYDPNSFLTLEEAADRLNRPLTLITERCQSGIYESRLDYGVTGEPIRFMHMDAFEAYKDGSINDLMTFQSAIDLLLDANHDAPCHVRRPTWPGYGYLWYDESADDLLASLPLDKSCLDEVYRYPVFYSPGSDDSEDSDIYQPTPEDRTATDWHRCYFG